jgi:hypothetical protein
MQRFASRAEAVAVYHRRNAKRGVPRRGRLEGRLYGPKEAPDVAAGEPSEGWSMQDTPLLRTDRDDWALGVSAAMEADPTEDTSTSEPRRAEYEEQPPVLPGRSR